MFVDYNFSLDIKNYRSKQYLILMKEQLKRKITYKKNLTYFLK